MATLGTTVVGINRITIYTTCHFSKSILYITSNKDLDKIKMSSSIDLYVDKQIRIDWREKYLLIIDEVNILGTRTLYIINK